MRSALALLALLNCAHRSQAPVVSPPPAPAPSAAAQPERRVPDPGQMLGECSPELAQGLFSDAPSYKVLILRFDGATDRDQEFGKKIANTLRTSFERFLEEEASTPEGQRAGVTPEQFEVRLVGCSVPSHKDARRIGLAWGADLVLWGTASCSLASADECNTIRLVDSPIAAGGGVIIAHPPSSSASQFHGEYMPSATLIRSLPLQVSTREGAPVLGAESASMVEWDLPRIATPKPVALLNLMIGLEAFSRPQYDSAARYLERAELELGASSEAAQRILYTMTTAYLYAGYPDRARERAESRVAACSAEPQCRGAALTSLGWVWSALGDKKRALEFYDQALPLRRQVGDVGGEATTLNNIGLVWDALGDKKRALEFYDQAIGLLRQVGDNWHLAVGLDNVAKAHADMKHSAEAAMSWIEAAELYLQRQPADVGKAVGSLDLALGVALANEDRATAYVIFDAVSRLNLDAGYLVRFLARYRITLNPPKTSDAAKLLAWFPSWSGASESSRVSAAELSQWIQSGEIDLTTGGLVVNRVLDGSQAQQAGIPLGAIILQYAGTTVSTPEALIEGVKTCNSMPACTSPELVWRSVGELHRATLRPGQIGIGTEPLW